MTEDDCLGVGLLQLCEQIVERCFLLRRTGVGRFAVSIEPTLIADAEGMAVMILAVCTDDLLRSARFDGAIPAHHIVVADAKGEVLRPVPGVNLLRR